MSRTSKIALAFLIASLISCFIAAPVPGHATANSHDEADSSHKVDHASGSPQKITYPGIGAWLSRSAGYSSGDLPPEGSKSAVGTVKEISEDSPFKFEVDTDQKLGTVRAQTDEKVEITSSKNGGNETEKVVHDESKVDEVMDVENVENADENHGAVEDDWMDYDDLEADEGEDSEYDDLESELDDEENTGEDLQLDGEKSYSAEGKSSEDDDGEGLENLTEEEIEALAEESEWEDDGDMGGWEKEEETAVDGKTFNSGLP